MTRVINIDIMNAALKACPHYGGVLYAVDSDERGLLFQWRWKGSDGNTVKFGGGVDRNKAAVMAYDEYTRVSVFKQFTHEMLIR